MKSFAFAPVLGFLFFVGLALEKKAAAQTAGAGDPAQGKTYFQQNCAICHAAALGPGNAPINQQGPSLVGVVGRRAASVPSFSYSKALSDSGLTWDAATLDKFLTNPGALVPGTTMPISVADAAKSRQRHRLSVHAQAARRRFCCRARSPPPLPARSASIPATGRTPRPASSTTSPWRTCPRPTPPTRPAMVPRPCRRRRMPSSPFRRASRSSSSPLGLSNPRIIRIAPNGDIFIAETGRQAHPRPARR